MGNLTNQLCVEFECYLPGVVSGFSVHPDVEFFLNETVAAHKHPLCSGGKRVRPVLVGLMAGSIAGTRSLDWALPAGAALECVHTYSLVHDDLPCMDNDDFRRGKPTTHKIFGEAKGLLVGDGLLTRAFEILSELPSGAHQATRSRATEWAALSSQVLAAAAGFRGMVFGQWIDMSKFSEAQQKSEELWKTIAFKKTGCLLGAAFELGVLSGLASVSNSNETLYSKKVGELRSIARECGEHVGLAFQIVDDILDVTASAEQMGKSTGKDLCQNKLTAVQLWGLDEAREVAAAQTQHARHLLAEVFGMLRIVVGTDLNSEYTAAIENLIDGLLVRQK